VERRRFPAGSPGGHVPAEVPYGGDVDVLYVPSLGGALCGGEVRRARDRTSRQLDAKHALAGLARALIEDAKAVVREHALHDELALLQLPALDKIAGRTLLGSPDDRQRLKVLRANRGQELLDRGAGRGGAGERTGVPRAARREYQNKRDDRTVHRMSPACL